MTVCLVKGYSSQKQRWDRKSNKLHLHTKTQRKGDNEGDTKDQNSQVPEWWARERTTQSPEELIKMGWKSLMGMTDSIAGES